MGLVTLQTIFQDAFPAYAQTHPLPAYVRKAARAIMQCRTAALGGHIQACPDGHVERIWYNSCRHRSCPQCAYRQTARWLARQRARLLACDHYHVIFTVPHDLNPLWLANVPVMTTLLFQAVRATLVALLADPQDLGAQPGILAALHTWRQTLVLHPHVHCLVTGGGLTPEGVWKPVRNGFLLPARVVMAVFRGKLRAAIRQAWTGGELVLPDELRPQPFLNLLHRLGHPRKTKWNVHIRERYAHGAGVVTYLARYLRGGPMKNARLVAFDGARVTCTCRPRREEADDDRPAASRMTWPVADVLQRWLLHVPGPQTRVVRSYGLYHPTHTEALAVCRTALGQPPVEVPAVLDWQTVCAQRGDLHPERCPTCGQLLVCTGVVPRGGPSLAPWAGWGAGGMSVGRWERPARGVVCLRAARAARRRACGSALGLSDLLTAPADASGRGRAGRGEAEGWRGRGRTLHSGRLQSPGQRASVRGPSNQSLELTPGRGGGVVLRGFVEARRSSTLSVRC